MAMRALKVISLVAVVAGAVLYGYFRYENPFGIRTCFLPCTMSALVVYAHENSDRYPDDLDPLVALQKLYPELIGDPELLAGISGDRKATAWCLAQGQRLTTNESSWVYIPGLSNTNAADTILIYERGSGLSFNGRRRPGRAVGFVDGSHQHMPELAFQELLKAQQGARTSRK